jgi:hypothetical protein
MTDYKGIERKVAVLRTYFDRHESELYTTEQRQQARHNFVKQYEFEPLTALGHKALLIFQEYITLDHQVALIINEKKSKS